MSKSIRVRVALQKAREALAQTQQSLAAVAALKAVSK